MSQEFSKEVEGKSSLKSSVVTEGNQLLRLKKVDTVVLRSDLARIDTQWTELLTRIPVVQEKLHQVLSHAARLDRLSCSRANRITPICCFTCIQKFLNMGNMLTADGIYISFCPPEFFICLISSQIQMEKLASRHAISELFNWISLMENVIEEDEENLKSAVGSNVIQDYLQKYKVVD